MEITCRHLLQTWRKSQRILRDTSKFEGQYSRIRNFMLSHR